MFCFLITASFVSIYFSENGEASGNEIYVDSAFHIKRDGTAENPWASIQEAINKANDGDTIYVFGGSYNETLSINKRLNITGSIDDKNSVINYKLDHKYTVEITADHVILEGFNITDNKNHIISYVNGALIHVVSDNVIIQRNNITNCHNGYGIYLDSSNGHVIGNNFIEQVETGVYVSSSDTNDLIRNNISNCDGASVRLHSSSNNRIYSNLLNNSNYGIYAKDCDNINISNSNINYNSAYGIKLYRDNNAVIQYNRISNNNLDGIHLNSFDSRVVSNVLNNNQIGINFDQYGCRIQGNFINDSTSTGLYAKSGSENNIIYLNFLNDNTINANEKGNNQWYYENQGNSWDDYNEVDRDHDGIGDTPYSIAVGIQDKYPMGVFLKPPDRPSGELPEDGDDDVGLKVNLSVEVSDPDSKFMNVYFYDASDDRLIGTTYNVADESTASFIYTLPFDMTFAWYVIANDSKLENRSEHIWYFVTEQCPPGNEEPTADPGGPYETEVGQVIVFDGSGSNDSDGEIDFYRWNFGDGTSEILAMFPSHSYSEDGTYDITLTVIDDGGRSGFAMTTVDVGASGTTQKPVADAGGPYSGYVGMVIVFNGSSSYDPDSDGMITNYTWRFDNGTELYGVTPAWVCNVSGEYNVTLTVTDNIGFKDTTSTTVVILPLDNDGTPGFELILSLIAIAFIFIWKRRRYC